MKLKMMNSKIYINDGLIELRNFISSKKIPERKIKKKTYSISLKNPRL